jgi:hypothetical protein
VNYRVVDASGKEVPRSAAKQALALMGRGFERLVEALEEAHPHEISTALAEIASIGKSGEEGRLYHVSQRFDGQRWAGYVEDVRSDFKVEFEIAPRRGEEGVAGWEAAVKLPFEWSGAIPFAVALFVRLDDEVSGLRMKVDELRELVREAEGSLKRLAGLDLRTLAGASRALKRLAHLSRIIRELEEELEEDEEEEW